MKNLKKLLICMLTLSTLFLVGCFNESKPETTPSNTDSKVEEPAKVETPSETKKDSKKQLYLTKLDELASNLDDSHDKRYSSSKTLDLLDAATAEHKQWDDYLNEIYSILIQDLPKEDMDKLRVEEEKWIEERDKKAQAASDEYKGGTFAPVNATISLANTTKDRCYELVNNYMK